MTRRLFLNLAVLALAAGTASAGETYKDKPYFPVTVGYAHGLLLQAGVVVGFG